MLSVYVYEAKPTLANRWRTLHHMKTAAIKVEWREAFFWLYKQAPCKFDVPVGITVRHEVVKGRIPDVASSMNCVKAAIDGLVDGGMLPDDSPEFLKSLTFLAPEKTGRDAVTLMVSPFVGQ